MKIERRKKYLKIEQIPSVQNWLPIEKVLEKGIVKMKDSSYIKIIKVSPINYNLKSELEKEAILNSYKNLFKSSYFNLQILVQSKKEDLSNNIKLLKSSENYKEIKEKYIEYIESLNKTKKSSCKNFYLIIKESTSEKNEKIKIENLQNEFFKIKESLSRCGNLVSEYTEDNQIYEILYSFLNSNKV